MATNPEDRVNAVIDVVARVMKLFWIERAIYLTAATAGMALFLYAVFLMIQGGRYDADFLGLVFGSGGIFTVAGGAILLLLNKTFDLVKDIVLARPDPVNQNAE